MSANFKALQLPIIRRLKHFLKNHAAYVLPNFDYSQVSWGEARASLENLRSKRSLQFVADRQLFTRRLRPKSLNDQLMLLDFLAHHPKLSPTSKHFAYIAACHKSMELLDYSLCENLYQQLDERIEAALHFPHHRSNIRRSGTHILSSTVVVQLHLELFLGKESFVASVETGATHWTPIIVRNKSRTLFKTSSNVARVLGMAALVSSIREDWTEAAKHVHELHEVFRQALHAAYVDKVAEDLFLQDVQILGLARRASEGKLSPRERTTLLHSCLRRENPEKVAIMTNNFFQIVNYNVPSCRSFISNQ